MTALSQDAQVEVMLAEYNALRSEIQQYSTRIDNISSAYIAAILAILSYALIPKSDLDLSSFYLKFTSNKEAMQILLIISMLNSILMTRVCSFYLAITALAQYCDKYLKSSLSRKLRTNKIIKWDENNGLDSKDRWLKTRFLSQAMLITFAHSFSIFIVYLSIIPEFFYGYYVIIYTTSVICIGLSFYGIYQVLMAGKKFHEPA